MNLFEQGDFTQHIIGEALAAFAVIQQERVEVGERFTFAPEKFYLLQDTREIFFHGLWKINFGACKRC